MNEESQMLKRNAQVAGMMIHNSLAGNSELSWELEDALKMTLSPKSASIAALTLILRSVPDPPGTCRRPRRHPTALETNRHAPEPAPVPSSHTPGPAVAAGSPRQEVCPVGQRPDQHRPADRDSRPRLRHHPGTRGGSKAVGRLPHPAHLRGSHGPPGSP